MGSIAMSLRTSSDACTVGYRLAARYITSSVVFIDNALALALANAKVERYRLVSEKMHIGEVFEVKARLQKRIVKGKPTWSGGTPLITQSVVTREFWLILPVIYACLKG